MPRRCHSKHSRFTHHYRESGSLQFVRSKRCILVYNTAPFTCPVLPPTNQPSNHILTNNQHNSRHSKTRCRYHHYLKTHPRSQLSQQIDEDAANFYIKTRHHSYSRCREQSEVYSSSANQPSSPSLFTWIVSTTISLSKT
ncbi:hypothetical protein SMACR_06562 [Sordaria macrospora]|uniref:Uncharacterized protein n=1 Tax=Sordaria macrospora TaxID=5147 RepID=A0A8S8ZZI0_SORMA|nr:hypothetical protein SMACR_06562 [Sordaria macrospora]